MSKKKETLALKDATRTLVTAIMDEFQKTRPEVEFIEIEFYGSGDDGSVNDITLQPDRDIVQHPEWQCSLEERSKIAEAAYAVLEDDSPGWENDDGSSGTVTLNLKKRTVSVDMEVYYTESNSRASLVKL